MKRLTTFIVLFAVITSLFFILFFKNKQLTQNFFENKITEIKNNSLSSKNTIQNKDFECVSGVAVPVEYANSQHAKEITTGIQEIKENLNCTIIWQLFSENASAQDYKTYFDIARSMGVKVFVANTTAGQFKPQPCKIDNNLQCEFEGTPMWNFINLYNSDKEVFNNVLLGFLLIDEPYEDINAQQLRGLYSAAKKLAPDLPLVVGWSKELYRFKTDEKPELKFTDGMCDVCLISALDVRDGVVQDDTIKNNHIVSRSIIKKADPEAKIYGSVPLFGNEDSRAGYSMPEYSQLEQVLNILLEDKEVQAAGNLDGILIQSWEAPNLNKVNRQQTLKDLPLNDSRISLLRDVCSN